jgi:competence protein ComEC
MSPPDLRLFGPALALWAATLVSLRVGAVVAISGAAALAALATLLAWRTSRRRGTAAGRSEGSRSDRIAKARARRRIALRWAGVALLLGAVCGALATAARTSARDARPLAALAAERSRVTATVETAGDPTALSAAAMGRVTYLVPARLIELRTPTASTTVDARILVFASTGQWASLLPGARVRTEGRLAPARGGDLTAAVLTATGDPELLRPPSWAQRAAGRLRADCRRPASVARGTRRTAARSRHRRHQPTRPGARRGVPGNRAHPSHRGQRQTSPSSWVSYSSRPGGVARVRG